MGGRKLGDKLKRWQPAEIEVLEGICQKYCKLADIVFEYNKTTEIKRNKGAIRALIMRKNIPVVGNESSADRPSLTHDWKLEEETLLKEICKETNILNEIYARFLTASRGKIGWIHRTKASVKGKLDREKYVTLRRLQSNEWSDEETRALKRTMKTHHELKTVYTAYNEWAKENKYPERKRKAVGHQRRKYLDNNFISPVLWTPEEIAALEKVAKGCCTMAEIFNEYNKVARTNGWSERTKGSIKGRYGKMSDYVVTQPNWTDEELEYLSDLLDKWPVPVAVDKYIQKCKRSDFFVRSRSGIITKIRKSGMLHRICKEDNFTIGELAQVLGVPYKRVETWTKQGLKHRRVLKNLYRHKSQKWATYIAKKDLQKFLRMNLDKVCDGDYEGIEWLLSAPFAKQAMKTLRKHGCVRIYQVEPNGKIVKVHRSMQEAAQSTYVGVQKMRNVIRNNDLLDGYYWEREDVRRKEGEKLVS